MSEITKKWDAITTVIKMNDKIERMANSMIIQQDKLAQFNDRIIRLEIELKMALKRAGSKRTKPIPARPHKQ
jgi:hypothetical protein